MQPSNNDQMHCTVNVTIQDGAYIGFAIADLLVYIVIAKDLIHYEYFSMNAASISLCSGLKYSGAYLSEEHQARCGECR